MQKENPLRKYLEDRGLTLTDFAKIAGLSITCVYDVSRGERSPGKIAIRKIEKATHKKVKAKDFVA